MEKKNLTEYLMLLRNSSAEDVLDFLSCVAKTSEERSGIIKAKISDLLREENIIITYCSEEGNWNDEGSKDSTGVLQVIDWDPILLWYLPNLCCIKDIEIMVRGVGLNSISSIGCGSGLLEWIITSLTGLEVTGYEVNKSWWNSPYAPPKFIPLVYVDADADADADADTDTDADADAEAIPSIPADHALLFCYFNDIVAFRSYLNKYKGDCLIIIGSVDGTRMTNPNPLELKGSHDWSLTLSHVKKNNDVICCYRRIKKLTLTSQSV